MVLFLDFFGIRDLDKIIFKCYSNFFNNYFLYNEKHNKHPKQTY
ncbi:hypothetical protein BAZOLSSOX_1355 [uncultured Gammaproteobacteria bacterium]|nr:hypothetical protein BAZOLSSOX_1355 [uncultured Gammaproteobacteria bacterium]